MRSVPAKFSNRKAFFIFGLMAGTILGIIYGMVAFNEWSRSHKFQSPIVFQPIIVEIKQAGPSATVSYVSGVEAKEEPKELTEDEKKDLAIRKYFPKQFALAKAVAMSEGYKSNGVNYNPPVEISTGLFQINLLAHAGKVPGKDLIEKGNWLKDYENNASVAREIYNSQSWQPWAGYTSGSYRRFL